MKISRNFIAFLSIPAMIFLAGCGSGIRILNDSSATVGSAHITSVQPSPIPQSDSPVLIQLQGGPFTPATTLNFRDASGNLLIENQPLNSSSPNTATVFASFANFPTAASVEIAGASSTQPAFPITLGGGNTPSPTDYPYLNASAPNAIPPNGILVPDMWGFDIGESTSYVAWKVNQSLGLTSFTTNKDGSFHFDTTQPHAFWNNADSTATVTQAWGDASNWQQHAEVLNKIDPTIYWDHNATAHSIYVDPTGNHVAWVEAVSTGPTGAITANLSEFDFSPPYGHQFSTRTITVSSSDIFIHDLGTTPHSGFTIAVDPTDLKQTITQGQSATFHTTVTSVAGFSSPVAWYAIGLPPGFASGTGWVPQVVTPAANGQASAIFTLSTNSLTATGTQMMTLKAISSNTSEIQEQTVAITVNAAKPAADYSIATPSTAVSVKAGQAIGIQLTATGTSNFAGTIALGALGWTSFGTTASKWSPTAIVLPSSTANNSGSSTFYLYISSTATPGTYPVTLHTTSGNLSHDIIVNVTVTPNPADYSIATTSTSVSVKAGQSVGIPLTATGTGSFAGTIALDAQGWTSFGTTASKWYPSNTIVLPSSTTNNSGSSTFYLYTSSTATPGTYPVTLHTTSGNLSHDIIVNVTVTPNPADYSIAAPNTAVTVVAGHDIGIQLTATGTGSFAGTIALQALGWTSFGTSSSYWSPTAIVLPGSSSNNSGSATFYLFTSSTATPGTYPVTLHTTSGNLAHDIIVNVTVTPNPADYRIAASNTSYTVSAGQSVGITLTATSIAGFTGTITPQALGLSSFASTNSKWSPPTIVLTSASTGSSGSSTFNLYANSTATPGTYPVTLHTASGSLTHDIVVSVTVTPNPADYSVATSSTSYTVKAGQSVGITLSAVSVAGFAGTITPQALGLSSFASTNSKWSPPTIVLTSASTGSTGSSTFYLYANSTATPGTYPVTLHTTSGNLTHDLIVNVTVTPNPADYSIATPNTAVSVKAGQAVGIQLTATGTSGFSGTITLDALGWTSFGSTTSRWSPTTIVLAPTVSGASSSTGSATFYLYTNASATPGTYPVTLHTTSGNLTHDLIVNITVTANPPVITSVTMATAVSSTSIEPLYIIGTGFSTVTGSGYAIFTDPGGITYSSKDYPARVISTSTTAWVFNMLDINQSPNVTGTWSVQMFNSSGQGSNIVPFVVK